LKKRLLHILFWSVLAAAFIGPGTVTTAASAGAGFGYSLIWALIFSTAACFVLQEASARITTVSSGMNLGHMMQKKYLSTKPGRWLIGLVLVSILAGCAAFEAGNILGAAAGISLVFETIPTPLITIMIGTTAALLLWKGTVKQVATLLGLIVAVMGFCFVITAFLIPHNWTAVFTGSVRPSIPAGAEILVLGLIGTTVVPYNIFLGSGLKHAQTVSEMRWGLFIAITLGGLISIAILLTGTAIAGVFTFGGLADTLSNQLGDGARWLVATGLFGAGISSALTAALAAAITAQSLLSKPGDPRWQEHGSRFRLTWGAVLAIGLVFGMLQIQPVPAIILAQALNGIILPVIAVILFLMMNDTKILPKSRQNKTFYNFFTGFVVYLTVLTGLTNFLRAATRFIGFELPGQTVILMLSTILFLLLIIPVIKNFFRKDS
jgi:manganese transport protein